MYMYRYSVARDGGERKMGAVTPGETLGTLYNIHVGSNKTKQHICIYVMYIHTVD
jgi:hypothetical protein